VKCHFSRDVGWQLLLQISDQATAGVCLSTIGGFGVPLARSNLYMKAMNPVAAIALGYPQNPETLSEGRYGENARKLQASSEILFSGGIGTKLHQCLRTGRSTRFKLSQVQYWFCRQWPFFTISLYCSLVFSRSHNDGLNPLSRALEKVQQHFFRRNRHCDVINRMNSFLIPELRKTQRLLGQIGSLATRRFRAIHKVPRRLARTMDVAV